MDKILSFFCTVSKNSTTWEISSVLNLLTFSSLIIFSVSNLIIQFSNLTDNPMKKTISLLALLLLFSFEIQAQVTNVLNNFYTVWVKPAIPIIGGLVLIVGALANIGKVLGDSRDYRGFITSIVLYLAVYFCLVGIVAFIMAG